MTDRPPAQDWFKELVRDQMDDLKQDAKELHKDFENLRIEVVKLQEQRTGRARLQGLIGGAIPAAIYLIYKLLIEG